MCILTSSGFDPRQSMIVLFFTVSRPSLGITHLPMQYIPGDLSLEVKRQEHEADSSLKSSVEINKFVITSPLLRTPSWHSPELIKQRDGLPQQLLNQTTDLSH